LEKRKVVKKGEQKNTTGGEQGRVLAGNLEKGLTPAREERAKKKKRGGGEERERRDRDMYGAS